MGDRNNPIKFGPEWLRNLARERSAGRANPNQNATRPGAPTNNRPSGSQGLGGPGSMSTGSTGTGSSNVATGSSSSSGSSGASLPTGPGASAAAVGAPPIAGTSGTNARNTNSNQHQKVKLAKLRYGREEMLALYDRTAEAPEELKYFDLLYQPRGKPPVALNTYDEETREARAGAGSERYGVGRGRGTPVEVRGRSRMPFVRHASAVSAGRGATSLHSGIPRMPGYSGGLDEEGPATRPWSGGNNSGPPNRTGGDQGDWTPSKMFRRRQANNTNWRQTSRDEGDEWRQENSRANPNRSNSDKWDRDWNEKPSQERPQSWNPNRRQWAGDSQNNDDNLPEWAIDSAEAGAGTFDSSGAFHGYSNDDSNIPKSQESTYPLTRSHTHGGSFVRSKTVEEGSEEWWASEKAKKLSPKRFEAGDSRYKKSLSTGSDEGSGGSSTARRTGNLDKSLNDLESSEGVNTPEPEPDASNSTTDDARQKFSESKTFDALMRSDIDYTDSSDERGNFQSVMITPNNSLRQKHQNIVTASNDPPMNRQHVNASGLLQMLHGIPMSAQNAESESAKSNEDKIVEDLMDMTLEDGHMRSNIGHHSNANNPGIMNQNQLLRIASPAMPQHGIAINTGQGIQNVGIPNQALNSSLGLTIAPGNSGMGLPMQGMLPPVLNTMNPAIGSAMQARVMGAYQQNAGMPVMPSPNVANSSLFMGQNNPQQLQNNDMQISTHTAQSNMFPMHGLQHASPGFSSIYSNILPPTNLGANMSTNIGPNMPTNLGGNISTNIGGTISGSMGGNIGNTISGNIGASIGGSIGANIGGAIGGNISGNNIGGNIGANIGGSINANLGDQWFYEDPKKVVQGPFSAKEMYSWYRAGFFSPSLMVRRACETHMRPLGSYGPVVPFVQMEVLPPYPITGFESRPQNHDMINQQPPLTMEGAFKTNVTNIHLATEPFMPLQVPPHYPHHFMDQPNILNTSRNEPPRFGIPPARLQRPMDSLWGQPGPNPDLMWMQQTMPRERVNNLPMFFWDQLQPSSAISSNSLLPEEIAKEMKTEDQILAQLRASQNLPNPSAFLKDTPSSSSTALNENAFSTNINPTPDLKQLQKLLTSDKLSSAPREAKAPSVEREIKQDKPNKREPTPTIETASKPQPPAKAHSESKATKQTKSESEKTKTKDATTKTKKQKAKEDKKDDDSKNKDDEKEKRSHEISPTKGKKDDKINKKELEKEKKEWIKEGFTIVKGSEKSNKESKKKLEEAKAVEEAERKKKEDEKVAAEEETRKRKVESKKQQEHQLRNMTETKKAPWSAQQSSQNRDGLSLDEIQRLEREKKLEQLREQHHMMLLLAQEQAAVAAREQVINDIHTNNVPWTKKNGDRPSNGSGQSFVEIQAETRRQSSASHSQAVVVEEAAAGPSHAPWSSSHNGEMVNTGGFWDTQPSSSKSDKVQDSSRAETSKKKKVTIAVVPKKENTPCAEFDTWSSSALSSWSSKIDVPTFVGFLKDIESPYEVKDYVKCYLGESKDSSDFARQFLERRSKLLRVGMVTPSDDLCSPAMAINPRAALDFQEGKGKKSKKNKMLKVDARILGFSVTASEDRINVGDIDTV